MTVLNDILDWSVDRPLWQRDALRRIVTKSDVNDHDVEEFLELCLTQRGTVEKESPAPTAEPLSEENVPQSDGGREKVTLLGLSEVHGVNALQPDQELSFGSEGLTLIFGYNGSGKSGYARILRAMCQARHRDDSILPNIFSVEPQGEPSARIEYNVGGDDHTEVWQQGESPPRSLSRISFFDSECAAVHVNEANELAFTPFGLDVLPKLVEVSKKLSTFIDQRIADEQRRQPASVANSNADSGTRVSNLLEGLDTSSDINDFRTLATLSEQERARIEELREALGSDPTTRAREFRSAVTRLERLRGHIENGENLLSGDNLESIRAQLDEFVSKRDAARAAADQAFNGQPLAGIGNDVWQQLWEAARRYSAESAYSTEEFPFTEEEARCVLCQQPLGSDAKARLNSFEAFIRDDTQRAAERSERALKQALSPVEQATLGHAAFGGNLHDLPDDQRELRLGIERFLRVAWIVRKHVTSSCQKETWTLPIGLTPSPKDELIAFIDGRRQRADELDRIAAGEERQALITEQSELLARQWLAGVINDVEAEIERKKRLELLRLAKRDTDTNRMTRQNGELTDRYATDVLGNTLQEEIRKVGAGHLPVYLESPGSKAGYKRFKIALKDATAEHSVRDVLSEGEFRSVALAGFLAELATEESKSAIIFDDPVSSLDHEWRRRIASRLSKVAVDRQVVVFTHDIVFLTDLLGFCEGKVAIQESYITRGPPGVAGQSIDGLPWAAMRVKDRVGRLKDWMQSAEATYMKQGREAYEPEARRICGRLRETWERAVEELLLNGVVKRFDRAVHTQQLDKLVDITDEDINVIEQGMTKSSRFLEGHDEAEAIGDPVPEPDEVRQDIQTLEGWIKEVRKRR